MKIYCVFFLSLFSFIILIYKILSAEEIKSNKIDKRFVKNSKFSSDSIDNFGSKGFFKKNKVEKKEEKTHDDLVIYITSPRSIQSNEGFFQIHISTFFLCLLFRVAGILCPGTGHPPVTHSAAMLRPAYLVIRLVRIFLRRLPKPHRGYAISPV